MEERLPVVRGHFVAVGVAVVEEVIDDQALLLGVLEPPDLAEQFGGLAGEHGAVDDLDGAAFLHSNAIIYNRHF